MMYSFSVVSYLSHYFIVGYKFKEIILIVWYNHPGNLYKWCEEGRYVSYMQMILGYLLFNCKDTSTIQTKIG